MTSTQSPFARFRAPCITFGLLALLAVSAPALRADETGKSATTAKLDPALERPLPESLDDLKAIQAQVKKVLDKVIPCTVCLQIGAGSGSGVIVSEDGYILTAAHVSGPADRDVRIILHDGRKVKGKTLGGNKGIDSGLVKITDGGKWPFVDVGKSSDLKRGQWCIATGHPGGFKPGRPPVVRVGRILDANKMVVQSDCTLVGGDSGGPLFDMHGRVIGIHSRIGNSITTNLHVPADTFTDTWDRLVKGEIWGGSLLGTPTANKAWLGVQGDTEADHCRIADVVAGSPAAKAGFKSDDVITKFANKAVGDFEDLVQQVGRRKIGDEITVEVRRGDQTLSLRVVLAKRPE